MSATVGICAHNEEETIEKLLDQILQADVPVEQIIVVVAGDDRTDEIVREKSKKYPEIELVVEEERRGQSAAQNEIFDRASEEALFLIDGDGWMKEGSMEKMWEVYESDCIVYGREIPDTPDTLVGRMIDRFWELHHEMSLIQPKYTTQLALQPTSLIDSIPGEIVIDDEYIGLKARDRGLEIKYVPEAEKYHNIKGDLLSYMRHRRKNWAGMFQIQSMGHENLQPTETKASFYLKKLAFNSWRNRFYITLLGAVEMTAFLGALKDAALRQWPYKWKR